MAVTFGSAVSVNAPAVYDATLAPTTGAATSGIGLKGADGAAVPGAMALGNPVAVVLKFDTDASTATP